MPKMTSLRSPRDLQYYAANFTSTDPRTHSNGLLRDIREEGWVYTKKRSFDEYLGPSDDSSSPPNKLRRISTEPSEFIPMSLAGYPDGPYTLGGFNAELSKELPNGLVNLVSTGRPDPSPFWTHSEPNYNLEYNAAENTVSPIESNDQVAVLPYDMRPSDANGGHGDPLGALRYPLYKHQQIALEWMKRKELDDRKRGGILADDMGLGKTVSTIALMVSRRDEPFPWTNIRTNLIVAPLSLLKQWEREIQQKIIPDRELSIFIYHSKKASYDTLAEYDVVLTTYGTLTSEAKKLENYINYTVGAGKKVSDDYLSRICPFLSPRSNFYRVILDEAQYIKNYKSKVSIVVSKLNAKYRWCLTGTPMQNEVMDLAALVRFLQIKPYHDPYLFRRRFKCIQSKSNRDPSIPEARNELQDFLSGFMLRRTKKSKLGGKPIVELKKKIEVVDHVVFDEDQKGFYDSLEQHSRVQFSKYLKGGTVGKHYAKVLVLLLRLRQACCHPHLHLTDLELAEPDIQDATIEPKESLPLSPELIRRINEADMFECSICREPVPDPCIVCPCGDYVCPLCVESFNNMLKVKNISFGDDAGSIVCPVCSREGEFRMIDFDTFKRVYSSVKAEDEYYNDSDVSDTDDDSAFSSYSDDTDDVDEDGNLKGFVVNDDEFGHSNSRAVYPNSGRERKRKRKSRSKSNAFVNPHKFAKLRAKAIQSQKARKKYMSTLRQVWMPSAKVTKCCELISTIQSTTGEKIIVFSQWTILLDILEIAITDQLNLRVSRYDGTMTSAKRDDALNEFTNDPEVKVILVSLKAGNAGLNLTAASQVIIMGPFWNPYVENQAVDRAYRIGQHRDVTVHRILVEGTVEDRIMATQDKKRKTVRLVLSRGGSGEVSGLDVKDLAFLFGVESTSDE